jgi:type I restriction enzyme, S subunit
MAVLNKPEFKHSPIGPIPLDWEVKELAEITDAKRPISYGIVQTGESVTNGVKCIRVIDLVNGKINSENLITTSKKISDGYKRTILRKGDLVLALRGKIGEVAIVEEKLTGANLTRGVALIATNESIDKEFLKQQIASPRTKIVLEKSLNGSALQEISIGVLRKIPVVLPKLVEEQRAISSTLLTWDKAIDKTNQLIAAKEQRKKWLMQQLLSGRERLKGFGNAKWEKFSYDQVLKEVYRPVKWNDKDLYKLLSVRRRSGGIFLREALFGHQIKVKDLRNVQTGDFLFSKMQIVHGASALVTKEFDGAKISASYIAVVAKDPKVLQLEFLNWYSKLPYFYHQTYISSYGVTIEKMTFQFDYFLQLSLSLPSIAEQKAIANVLETADKEINLLKQKLEAYKEQKKGLMQVLLTGKVRLKVKQ